MERYNYSSPLFGRPLGEAATDHWFRINRESGEGLNFAEVMAILAGGEVIGGVTWFQGSGFLSEPSIEDPVGPYNKVETLLALLLKADMQDEVTSSLIELIVDRKISDIDKVRRALQCLAHY